MADQTPLEAFKSVLTGTARALAHEPEVELARLVTVCVVAVELKVVGVWGSAPM